MAWGFLTNHAQALLCIAEDPGVRLREIASTLGITERAAYGIVAELVDAGYVDKTKHGRRNRYRVHAHKPLPETLLRQRTVGQLLALLTHPADAAGAQSDTRPLPDRARACPERGPH
jgi:DNA-binding IclR family transcriptional regulator